MRTLPKRLQFCLLAVALLGCGHAPTPRERDTRRTGASGDAPIVVGIAWPWEARKELAFGSGVQLAVEQVNQSGGVRGRSVRILRADDGEDVDRGRLVAQSLGANPEVAAVIGHMQSYVTVPAAAVYDLSGKVLLSPAATSPELTRRGYRRVFRTTFSDADVGRQLAAFAGSRGYKRIAIYYSRDEYGRGLANSFEEHATADGAHVIDRRSYDPGASDNALPAVDAVETWQGLNPDAVFIAGDGEQGALLAAELRRRGLQLPLLGGDAVAIPDFLRLGGTATEGAVIASRFSPESPTPQVQRFTREFRARFGADPDVAAALGYDAVTLLSTAMREASVVTPDEIAAALHRMRDWPGVTGTFTFGPAGDLVGRPVGLVVVRNGGFHHIDPASTVAELRGGRE